MSEAQTSGSANATRGLGTPMYMAPEQVLAQTMGPATDIHTRAGDFILVFFGADHSLMKLSGNELGDAGGRSSSSTMTTAPTGRLPT